MTLPTGQPLPEYPVSDTDIAVIGMAGQFPGAANVEEFWRNIRDGHESVQFFSDEALQAAGVPAFMLQDPNYVKAAAVLENIEYFDAPFFGFSPREAEMMDPQHRLFLEQAWTALEHAGYATDQYEGAIAVYAGTGINQYLLSQLYPRMQQADGGVTYQAIIRNDKDFLPTLVSYKLNLKGPSIAVQTACSTSLVAVHMACQSLLNGECDMALAGAVSIHVDQKRGYLYEEGMIMSPDGHCRAFDADARGTVLGSGAATVVLKRLADALEDGDTVHAVLKGSAVNNDGDNKVGYTAPSVSGQAAVIAEAQAIAGVDPNTITYIEAHGTGTVLGDPIEIAALNEAFQDSDQPCAIGSVKTNVGHLDTASGVTGVIKAVLALQHRQIPPSLHYQSPNPAINFDRGPFFVNAQLTNWNPGDMSRRAGVSSFGIGGTNAHVVLEEAPLVAPSGPSRTTQLIPLSAKTPTALTALSTNLAAFLQANPETDLADVAYTLSRGRQGLDCRHTLVANTLDQAVAGLEAWVKQSQPSPKFSRPDCRTTTAFMFSGQGSQYVNMGRDLYDSEPVFRNAVDCCSKILFPLLGVDLHKFLYPADKSLIDICTTKLNQTTFTQPALFVVEYALAQLWMAWGVKPQAMIGHSIGEYVAACIAGVFSLEDGLQLVASRGQLMQSLPMGSMLAISLPADQVMALIEDYPHIDLATLNGPVCVVSGPTSEITALQTQLETTGADGIVITCRRLHTSHAFHSKMMEPILPTFTRHVEIIKLQAPQIPYLSNVTGTWITEDQATDPNYWAQHLRLPVRFADGLDQLLDDPTVQLLEVGPGRSLSQLAKRHPAFQANHYCVTSLRHPQETASDVAFILKSLGDLWANGSTVHWAGVYGEQQRRRLPLPTYPFERQRYWLEATETSGLDLRQFQTVPRKPEVTDWFYEPSWVRSQLPPIVTQLPPATWLIFLDALGLGQQLAQRLTQLGQTVWTVAVGNQWEILGDRTLALNPENPEDFDQLITHLQQQDQLPNKILHGWGLSHITQRNLDLEQANYHQTLGLHTLISLAQSLGKLPRFPDIELFTIANGLYSVTGDETIHPTKVTALAPIKILPIEYPHIHCRSIDVIPSGLGVTDKLVTQVLAECCHPSDALEVAYRGSCRWTPTYIPSAIPSTANDVPAMARLQPQGVYLVTGGLGGIGLTLAQYLAQSVQARLVLVKRSPFIPKDQWAAWLDSHDTEDATAETIRRLQALETAGGAVEVMAADVTDQSQMQQVVDATLETYGAINGVLHCAGLADFGGIVQGRTRADSDLILAAKLQGTLVLQQVLAQQPLDFFVLSSSLSATLYKTLFGQVAYCAANDFLDAFAHHHTATTGTFTLAIDWTEWLEVGMAVNSQAQQADDNSMAAQLALDDVLLGITPSEGQQAFHHLLYQPAPRIVVSTQDLTALLRQQAAFNPHEFLQQFMMQEPDPDAVKYPRPDLGVDYVAPQTPLQQFVAELWQTFLGLEPVGLDDNFFDLGGDSLSSLGLTTQIEAKLDIELGSNVLLTNATLTEFVSYLESNYDASLAPFLTKTSTHQTSTTQTNKTKSGQPPEVRESVQAPSSPSIGAAVVPQGKIDPLVPVSQKATITAATLVRMQRGSSDQPPLFFAHPIGGGVACYTTLGRHLNSDRPFYGLRAVGMDDGQTPYTDIRTMAASYLEAIRTIQPHGPYHLGGWSMGGVIAYEMAQQLGHDVATVIMVDSPAPIRKDDPDPLMTQLFVFARSLGIPQLQAGILVESENFQALELRAQLESILHQGIGLRLLPKSFEAERITALFEVFRSNNVALKQYVASRDITSASMLYVRADDSRTAITSDHDEQGWHQLAGDVVNFTYAPGDHYSMVLKPHATALAQQIEQHLLNLRRLPLAQC